MGYLLASCNKEAAITPAKTNQVVVIPTNTPVPVFVDQMVSFSDNAPFLPEDPKVPDVPILPSGPISKFFGRWVDVHGTSVVVLTDKNETYIELWEKVGGVYVLQTLNGRASPRMPPDILELVQEP